MKLSDKTYITLRKAIEERLQVCITNSIACEKLEAPATTNYWIDEAANAILARAELDQHMKG